MRLAHASFRFNDLPGELSDLRAQLAAGEADSPAHLLGPISALTEVLFTCANVGQGGVVNQDDRGSLVTDLGLLRGALGSRTLAAAEPELGDFFGQLGGMSKRLSSSSGARGIELAAASLLDALRRPTVARAAWRDVVDAFQDASVPVELCMYRLRVLEEISEQRGHQWQPTALAHQLALRLGDHKVLLAIANGDADREPTPLAERLLACEGCVGNEPYRKDVAVWLLIAHAPLSPGYLSLGPIQLFDRQSLTDEESAASAALKNLPEYESWDEARTRLDAIPDARNVTLARVWLPDWHPWRASAHARDIVQSLVDISYPTTSWLIWEGHMGWSDGDFRGPKFHEPEPDDRTRLARTRFDQTAEGLQTFDGAFVQRLVDGDPRAEEAVEDARWTVALRRASSHQQRVALGTRALERSLGAAQASTEEWRQVTERYLKAPWVLVALQDELWAAAVAATRDMCWAPGHPSDEEVDIYDLVLKVVSPDTRVPSNEGLASVWERYAHHWQQACLAARLVAGADRVLNHPDEALARLSELERRFELLLARAERQRNAMIHGRRPVDGVLATVDEFLLELNAFAADDSMHSAETGEPPLVRLQRWRVEALHRRKRLHDGARLNDVLPNDDDDS